MEELNIALCLLRKQNNSLYTVDIETITVAFIVTFCAAAQRLCLFKYLEILEILEAGRGAAARGVTAKPAGSGFDSHSRR